MLCIPDVSGIDDFQVLGQTEVSIQVGWKNPPAEVDYFRLTATSPSGQEEQLSVQRSQEARTKHTIVGQCMTPPFYLKLGLCFTLQRDKCGATGLFNIAMMQTAFHSSFLFKWIFFTGLFPGTDYQILVQAVKGAVEGKSSSVTGGTGQPSPASTFFVANTLVKLIFQFMKGTFCNSEKDCRKLKRSSDQIKLNDRSHVEIKH